MTSSDDHSLLTQIARGDQEALRQLYTRYRPRLYRYLWRQLDGNAGAVEEALQDVFVAAWRTAGRFRGDAQVATWLFQIAHHRVLHVQRDRDRRAEGHLASTKETLEESTADLPGHTASCEDAVLDRLLLIEALSQLSAKHQEVLDLVFLQGFSLEEVASILDVPGGTVKSRVAYARRALLKRFAAAQQEEEPSHD